MPAAATPMIEDDEAVGSVFRAILNRSAIEFRKHTLRGGDPSLPGCSG